MMSKHVVEKHEPKISGFLFLSTTEIRPNNGQLKPVPRKNRAVIGLCCGAYMLAYTIANELAPKGAISTCTGFTNTLAIIITPILQPLVGYLLDEFSKTKTYTLEDYQFALIAVPASIFLASLLVYFLPEKTHHASDSSTAPLTHNLTQLRT